MSSNHMFISNQCNHSDITTLMKNRVQPSNINTHYTCKSCGLFVSKRNVSGTRMEDDQYQPLAAAEREDIQRKEFYKNNLIYQCDHNNPNSLTQVGYHEKDKVMIYRCRVCGVHIRRKKNFAPACVRPSA